MKRLLTWAALLLAMAAALLAAAWAGRDRLLAAPIKSLVEEVLREEAGLEVAIDFLSGSYLRDIEIRGLKTLGPSPSGPVSRIAADRIHVRYRLLFLLHGMERFISTATVTIVSPHLEIDLDRWDAAEPAAARSDRPSALPAVLPVVRVTDGVLVLSSAPLRAVFEGLSLTTARGPESELSLDLSVPRLLAGRHPPREGGGDPALAGKLQLRAQAPWPPPAGEVAVDRFQLEFTGRRPADDAPVRLQAAAALRGGRLRIDRIELAAGRSRLLVTEAGAPWESVAAGDVWALIRAASGRISLTSDEIPRLIAALGANLPAGGSQIPDHRLSLEGRLEAGEVQVSRAELIAGEASIRLDHFETRLTSEAWDAPLTASLTADLPDLGTVAALFNRPVLSGALAAKLHVSGTLGDPQGRADAAVRGLAVEGAPIGNLHLRADASGHRVRIESIELTEGADRLFARGVLRLPELRLEETRLEFFVRDLGKRLERLPPAWGIGGAQWSLGGQLRGAADLEGPWRHPDGELALEVQGLHLRGRPLGSGSARLHKQGDAIAADPITMTHGTDRLILKGRFDLAAQRFGATRLELTAGEIGPYLAAFDLDAPELSGRLSVRLEGSGPLMAPDVRLDAFLGRLQAGDWQLSDNRVQAAGAKGRIRFEQIESLTPIGQVRLSGNVEADHARGVFTATVDRLDLSGEVSLALTRPASLRYASPGVVTLSGVEAAGPPGRIAVHGTLSHRGRSDLTVNLFEVSGRGWLRALTGLPIDLEGLDASLRAAGTLDAPVISAAGSIRHLQVHPGTGAGSGRFDLAFSEERLRIHTFEMSMNGGESLRIAGVLPAALSPSPRLARGDLNLEVDLGLPGQQTLRALAPAWPFASGSLRGELRVSGSWQAPAATLNLTGRDLVPSEAAVLPPGSYMTEGEVLLQGRRIQLTRLEMRGPSAAFEANGEITELPSLPDLVAGSVEARRERISVRAALRIDELDWAARGLAGVRRTAGRIEADALIAGPLAGPELTADLRLIDGEVRPEGGLPPLHHLELDAGFGGQRLEIRSLQGEAGGAPFRITGELDTDAPEAGKAALRLEGDNLLLFRSETVTLRANTRLRLTGPLAAATLEGDLAITDGRLSTRWRFLDTFLTPGRPASESGLRLFSIQTPPFRDMRFQVRISSMAPFRMRTNVARGEVRPDLLLGGTGESPVLTGVVYVDPGRLSLPSTTLRIESGLIRFLPAAPERPVVNLMGTGRVYGYDITLRVEGPYDAPEIYLSSVPPLAHEELLWMLLTGEPPRQEAALSESQQAGMKVAVFVGRDFITHWLESALPESDETVLDRLDVEVGRSVSRTGQQTIEAQFRLTEGFIRRGDTLYLVGEKDIYDTYNMGVRLVFRFQ